LPFVDIPDPDFNGWYIEASWFFGGRQTYEKEGKWGRPKIAHPVTWSKGSGWGGLQIVGKYDVLDQSDSAFNNAGVSHDKIVPGCSVDRVQSDAQGQNSIGYAKRRNTSGVLD
jgi:hypothetical protein